ncbi:MAG: T9SS type A sorting domain-containing protein [Bacteroidetes bacterium]|nr:T9SS type A sorting domain-containing protein [Bacteroidota bacterium]
MKKIILLFLLLPVFVSAQIVNIPDANFKAYLVGNTSINTNGDGEIQVIEASAFTDTIDVSWLGISDLTGIKAFTALTYLNCQSNSLTSLDVTSNTALTNLNCRSNSLTSLDVSNNTALTYLNCRSNSLTGLDVTQNTVLTFLDCYYNSLTGLDVTQNTALTNLWCYGNSLTSLDVSNNTALTGLSCYSNLLTGLDVSNNTVLQYLSCAWNSLTSLDVRNGNNINMPGSGFEAMSNPNLTCISVDDTVYSNANWSGSKDKDAWAVYSNDCIALGIEDNEPNHPIITTQNNSITIQGKGTASIFNLQGQRVHQSKLLGKTSISLDKGIYLVRVSASGGGRSVTKKVYLN